MKNIPILKFLILWLLLTLGYQLCQAQYLNFDELVSLRAKELDEVNDFLIKKKWEIDNAQEGDFFDYNRATWAFNKHDYNNKANAWFTYLYSDGSTNIIRYMTTSSNYHDLIKTRIKILGFKLSNKAIEEKGLAFTYSNGDRSVKVTIDKDDDGVARYVFTIRKDIPNPTMITSNQKSLSSESGKLKPYNFIIKNKLIPLWKNEKLSEVEVDMLPVGAKILVLKKNDKMVYAKYTDQENETHFGFIFLSDLY